LGGAEQSICLELLALVTRGTRKFALQMRKCVNYTPTSLGVELNHGEISWLVQNWKKVTGSEAESEPNSESQLCIERHTFDFVTVTKTQDTKRNSLSISTTDEEDFYDWLQAIEFMINRTSLGSHENLKDLPPSLCDKYSSILDSFAENVPFDLLHTFV
jgi:hypothetical protein